MRLIPLLLGLFLFGLCGLVNGEADSELAEYFKIDADHRREWETVKEMARLKQAQPTAFGIIYPAFMQKHKDFKGTQQAHHFLTVYIQEINKFESDSPDSLHNFNVKLQTEWDKLNEEQKKELRNWAPNGK